jgi:hypothetical protein
MKKVRKDVQAEKLELGKRCIATFHGQVVKQGNHPSRRMPRYKALQFYITK